MDSPANNSSRLGVRPGRPGERKISNQTLPDSLAVANSGGSAPSERGSAPNTFPDNQNAPETIPPVLLANVVKRHGMLYREFWRQDNVSIYCAKGKGSRIEYEVFKVQILPAGQLGGRSYPLRESFPPNSEWGVSGWTFTNNSHCDPLAAVLAKAQRIASRRASQ